MIVQGTTPRPARAEDLLDSRLLAALERFDVRTRKMFPGKLQGERRSKRRGQSVEFEDYRNYVAGDDLRFIDWHAYARLDRLFVKVFLEDEDLAVHLAVDASASMDAGPPSKLGSAAKLAAGLGALALARNNRVTVSVFGQPGATGVERLPDTRGRRQQRRLAAFLHDALWRGRDAGVVATGPPGAPGPGADFNEALATIARNRVGKGVMFVLSDFLSPDGYEGGLRAVAAAGGYDTYCLQILAPGEIDPASSGGGAAGPAIEGDLRLTDVETGQAAEVTVSPALLDRYRRRLNEHLEGLSSYCGSRGMTHVVVRSDADAREVLLGPVRRAGALG